MSVLRLSCPFHSDDDLAGVRNSDATYTFTCERPGHPLPGSFSWLHDQEAASQTGLGGLADELGLDVELPAALAALGEGWFEYGLVEREYALRKPEDFRQMVDRWSHTAIAPQDYSTSSYIAGALGRLSRAGAIYFRQGSGTGRWSYNKEISYWSLKPDSDWDVRTTWVSVFRDSSPEDITADVECRHYVLTADGR